MTLSHYLRMKNDYDDDNGDDDTLTSIVMKLMALTASEWLVLEI